MTISTLVTHSGGFHADEVLSTVILSRLYPEAEIVRTRSPQWITPAEGRLIYDVGGAYDPEAGIFDHHQRESPLREDETPYSSFGLVWKHFGMDYLRSFDISEDQLEGIHGSFDRSFVLPVDQVDNGVVSQSEAGPLASLTLPGLIETLKPVFDDTDPESETRAFHAAVAIARQFVEARIGRSAAKRRAEVLAREAIDAAGDSPILVLPMGMPFRPAVTEAGADHLLFVVTPRGDNDWTIGGIRKYDQGFEQRADLPEAWAGLSGEALEDASGVKGAKFCHKARFIAAASSREAIMTMAQLAVDEAFRVNPDLAAGATSTT